MGFWDTLKDIGEAGLDIATGKPLIEVGKWIGSHGDDISEFLFGSDPGAENRDVLSAFGKTGSLGGQNQQQLLNSIIGSQPAQQTMDASERLARAGLLGSGKAQDTFQSINMQKADDLRKARMALLDKRLRALGVGANAPAEPGFIQSAVPIVGSLLGG